jgi:hypothetical protein
MLTESVAPEMVAACEGRWNRPCGNELSAAAAAAAAAVAALSATILLLLGLCGQITVDSWSQREPAKTSEPKILPRSLTNRHNSRTAPRLPAEHNYRALQPTSSHTDMPVRLGDLDSSRQTEAEAEPEAETPSLRNSNTRTSSAGLATCFLQGFGRSQCASGCSGTTFEGMGERMLVLHEPTDHTAGRAHHTQGRSHWITAHDT